MPDIYKNTSILYLITLFPQAEMWFPHCFNLFVAEKQWQSIFFLSFFDKATGNSHVTRLRWLKLPAYLLSICVLCVGGSGFPAPLLWAPAALCTRLNVPRSHALPSLWCWEPQRHTASHTSVCSPLSCTQWKCVVSHKASGLFSGSDTTEGHFTDQPSGLVVTQCWDIKLKYNHLKML